MQRRAYISSRALSSGSTAFPFSEIISRLFYENLSFWEGIVNPRYFRYLVFIFCALNENFSFSQTDTKGMEEIIVVSNRIPIPLKKIATSVSVVNEQEILNYGNISIKDVIRQTTAIGTTSNGGMGSTSSIRIRGEEGFRTLVLFDGLRLSDPSAPQVTTPIEHLLSNGINKIEILRGPQGLSYGADAGGVISISTNSEEEGFKLNIDGQTGSFGTELGSVTLSANNKEIDLSLFASELNAEGYNARTSDNIFADDDGYENDTIHVRMGANLNEKLRLQVVHRNVEGRTEYDGCFAEITVYDCESIYQLANSRISLDFSNDGYSHSLAYSKNETKREDFALRNLAFGSEGQINRLEYIGSATNLPGFDMVFGIDLEEEINGPMERNNRGYYLEYISDFSDNFFLTAGARRDSNDDYGDHNSFRTTSAYLINWSNSQLKFKTSYGSGLRAPSLYEINYNSGPFAFPPASNTNLSQELSKGFEYGAEYVRNNNFRLELTAFDQKVEDAIYFDLAGYSGYLQDKGTSRSKGLELDGSFSLSNSIRFLANYTYNDTKRPNGLQRLRRPKTIFNFGINYLDPTEKLRLNAFYRASRDSIDEQLGSTLALTDFGVLDFSASYQLSLNFEIFARIENALNEKYQEIIGYIAPKRSSYLGFRLYF